MDNITFKMILKIFFRHQYRVFRPFINGLYDVISFPMKWVVAVFLDIKNGGSFLLYGSFLTFFKKEGIYRGDTNKLQLSNFNEDKVKITFYAAIRRARNPNCKLEKFLESLIMHTSDLSQIEVLTAIDPDDDILYFEKLKAKYDRFLRFRIFVADKRYGYENLHLYDTALFKSAAKNTRMLCDYSDDCIIINPQFDKKLLEIDSLYPDNVYFIHTRNTERHQYLGDVSKNLLLLYWIMQAKEPASYFPIVSKKILEIASEYAATHDQDKEWSPIANTWICDCYVDILATLVKKAGVDRVHFVDMIKMKDSLVATHQKADPVTGMTPNNRAFMKMLNDNTINYLYGLADQIAQYCSSNSSRINPIYENHTA